MAGVQTNVNRSSKSFKKRTGSTDLGKDYEHLYIANLVFKLLSDDTVENFSLSSNDEDFGAFDDVVIEVKYFDRRQYQTYACQLKQKQSKKRNLVAAALTASEGDFSIKKYFDSRKGNKSESGTNLVLITNSSCHLDDGSIIKLNIEEGVEVKICKREPLELLATSSKGLCYSFTPSGNKYDFFESFFLYTSQASVTEIEKDTEVLFRTRFSSDRRAFEDYVNFITKWSKKEGTKDKLDKIWMQRVITLCVLSPFIKPLSFSSKPVNKKRKLLQEALSKFSRVTFRKESYDKLRTVWEDAGQGLCDLEEMNRVIINYQLNLEQQTGIYGENEEVSKLAWLLGLCPLVVEGSVTQACQTKNIVFLCAGARKLSDLRSERVYSEILTNFTISLEGQREISLDSLTAVSQDIENIITMDELVQMIDGPLLIGEKKEQPPSCYIPRQLSSVSVNLEVLQLLQYDSLILISCIKEIEKLKARFQVVQIEGIYRTDRRKNILYVTRNDCSLQEFETLCSQCPGKKSYHHLRYIRDDFLEWVNSVNGIDTLRDYIFDNAIREEDLFNDSRNINVVCASPGMGKSTLMKSLKRSSGIWTILIYARNLAPFFRKYGKDSVKFMDYVCDVSCYKKFDQSIFRILASERRVQLIWDGVDEVSESTLDSVLHFVNVFCVKQWITSRNSLKGVLEEKLQVFARSIQEFDDIQQRDYMEARLGADKVKQNIELFMNKDILGVPLQIYMLTELLRRDKKTIDLLNQSFTLANLYHYFVEGKFAVYYEEKEKCDLNIETNIRRIEREMASKKKWYKEAAITLYFGDLILKSVSSECQEFLDEIKKGQDFVGLIIDVIEDNTPEFMHNSYGEYFAALYLADTYETNVRNKNFIFDEKYQNIRFFLDLILSQSSKAHVAVLYRNCQLLEQCSEEDLECEDQAGRKVLELACTWVQMLQLPKVEKDQEGQLVVHYVDNIRDVKFGKYARKDVEKYLTYFEKLSLELKKVTLLLPFAIKLYDEKGFSDEHLAMLACCAVDFDYPIVLNLVENFPIIQHTGWHNTIYQKTLLHFAMDRKSVKCLTRLIQINEYRKLILYDSGILVDIVGSDLYRKVENVLLENGISINYTDENEGMTPLHYAIYWSRGTSYIEKLLSNGSRVDIVDNSGKLPIHYACMSSDQDSYKVLSLLLDRGAQVDVFDADGNLPLYYACLSHSPTSNKVVEMLLAEGADIDMIGTDDDFLTDSLRRSNSFCSNQNLQFLIDREVRIDIPDSDGKLPIHYICESSYEFAYEAVDTLIKNGAEVDVADSEGKLPIHYACQSESTYGYRTVQTLITNGSKMEVADAEGKLPIHYACMNRSRNSHLIIQTLSENGAQVNIKDAEGKLPIHYACISIDSLNVLLESGAAVNIPDKKGKLPLHYACSSDSEKVVELLLQKGSRMDPDMEGNFPLHYACLNMSYFSFEIVKLLLDKGADVDCLNTRRKTPLHSAYIRKCEPVVELLISRGAKVDTADGVINLPTGKCATEAVLEEF